MTLMFCRGKPSRARVGQAKSKLNWKAEFLELLIHSTILYSALTRDQARSHARSSSSTEASFHNTLAKTGYYPLKLFANFGSEKYFTVVFILNF